MAMTLQNQDTTAAPSFTVEETDPTRIVTIARDGHLRDNRPTNFQTSINDFFETLSSPDPRVRTKDGPGFLAGMTTGGRKAASFPSHEFAILDADSSILPDGRVVDGAPPPRETEEALISLGLTHCLYTTFSHGSSKGHRYRIVFPVHTSSKAQLRGVILYLVGALQNAGVPIALTRESYTVPSRWHYPRTETSDAPFYSAVSFAYNLTHSAARYLAMHFQQVDENEQEIPTAPALPANEREPIPGKLSLMDTFCSYFSISEILLAHGYTFAGHHVLLSETGRESPAMRFKK
ncbi:MAG: hypothetical protein EOL89_14675, partial [Actinobacteria bacterium]|nr:hypothetical protein [Actinomycetota bacterium]